MLRFLWLDSALPWFSVLSQCCDWTPSIPQHTFLFSTYAPMPDTSSEHVRAIQVKEFEGQLLIHRQQISLLSLLGSAVDCKMYPLNIFILFITPKEILQITVNKTLERTGHSPRPPSANRSSQFILLFTSWLQMRVCAMALNVIRTVHCDLFAPASIDKLQCVSLDVNFLPELPSEKQTPSSVGCSGDARQYMPTYNCQI